MSETADTIRVLHVDDEPGLVDMAATFLEREDNRIDVRTANSPTDGLEILGDYELDCIVSDYDMPQTNGIEFLEAVREEYPELPFILYTGKGSEEIASEAISSGVTDYLQKESGTSQYTVLAHRIQNVVEQYQARQAVEQTEQKLTQLAEKSDDILFMFNEDWSELLFTNSAFEDIWGISVEQVEENSEAFIEYIHPEDRDDVRRSMEQISKGQPDEIEYRIIPPDGDQRWVRAQSKPIFDSEGSITRIVGYVRDITEQKEHTRRFEAIFNNTYTFVGLLEPDGTLIEANDTALSFGGLDRDDVIGNKMWEATWFEYSQETKDRARKAVKSAAQGEFVRHELPVKGAGREAIIDFSVRPVLNDEGEVTLLIPEGRDITERKEHEQKRQQIIDRMNDAVIEVDSNWEITVVNDPVEEFTGQDESELLGQDFWDVFAEARGTEFERKYRQAMETREGTTIVEYYSGVDEWFDIDVYPNDDGGLAFYFLSVTEHKQREKELERTRDFFNEAERLGNLGAWEFSASGELVWTDGTRRIHKVDDKFEPTLDEGVQFFHPEDRETIEQAVESALESGASYDREARLITANDNQRWVRTRGHVLADTDQPTVRGYIQDITEQKEREEQLQKTNAQLENAIEAGAVGTWEWHIPENRLVVGNEFAKRFGVDPDVAQDGVELDRFISSIHEDDREWVEQEIEAAMDACGEYEAEYRVWNIDDELKWVLARGYVECDDDGTPITFPGVLVDITERKQIEQELHQQNERLDEFASVVSHDLRSPLSVVEGRLELAQEECESEHLDVIGTATDRMDRIIEDVLWLARAKQEIGSVEPTVMQTTVDAAWNLVADDVDQAELLYADEKRPLPTIKADENRLSQLLENLLRNAIEHGGTDVTVTVGPLENGFYVEDDGPGIPQDKREDVFAAGYSTDKEGTGFGLNIVNQVAEEHNWEIRVTDGRDGGARFEITGVEDNQKTAE
ncbi:hybrid sensor histidine kinase/response regulator [Halobellus salinisoli]|uniref:hybrid sensor histidine kinase/response regulator n=1 Tax=Halobellus salinisoli TaxID=3108500 RepID=UPI00300AF56D